ncbi:MAG: glutathione transferase GstA [Aquabacterium sp.]
MKLYYTPGVCSLAPHILLKETGLPHELVRVDLATKQTEHGEDYRRIAAKGSVPLLGLDDGSVLSEGPVIAQYICDQAGRPDLMPEAGSMARYRVMEWQNFLTSELHKGFSPLFNAQASAEVKDYARRLLKAKFAWVSQQLEGREHLTGATFTAADAYLFTITTWTRKADVDIDGNEALARFMTRVAARAAVQAARRAEGLLA